ncbi:MAG: hypothetical protein COV26_02030 [Candidatus Nealsonbacteria bacterium CG10_big_fil_rev_8_21_14_0_10_36_23]|uniref:Methyltransferase type 11 domain-containing protein n=2 Tax=Patescibacteria group TaxID=1783273 RepID=A0A2H0TKW9_9BACT|nr:MAG: hypothetical protein COV26_02030 [Candidatus Nealsonbacteria bacterium CG10_big_fil_rev_8_21_14_0_10_36_23]PJC28100.1 MAG: hypothetical protein CO054_01975 [Candidatus Shapirobacteria bacterium CG_4_9_14_0_2_um_filter_39_11]
MKDVWDKFSDLLGKTIFHPQYYLKSYEYMVVEAVKKYVKGILVDIGCGRQVYKKELLPFVKKYIGVDHPNISRLYKNKEKPDILADATKIPLKEGYCNTALMISVLEHLPYPQRAVKEANRILSKRGYLILITVQNYVLHDTPFDFFRYTRFGLKKILEDAGFKVITIKPLGNFFELMGQYLNVFLLYRTKDLIKSRRMKIAGYFAIPFVYALCLISNFIVFFFRKTLQKDRRGGFAIYNLAVAQKP